LGHRSVILYVDERVVVLQSVLLASIALAEMDMDLRLPESVACPVLL
jgi:hypothetical protein